MEQFCFQNFRAPVSARDAYAACDLQPTYGAILFRRHRGTTLTHHLTTLRIQHAITLLQTSSGGGSTICDIAYASGFKSLSRFYEAFTAHTGKTPTDYAANPRLIISDTGVVQPQSKPRPQPPAFKALWVDDSPDNILEERSLLSAHLGVHTHCVTTNAAALAALKATRYDLILSDIRRNGSPETGWEFAARLLDLNFSTPSSRPPLHIYTGFTSPDRHRLAKKFQAASLTARSKDLYSAIESSLALTPSKENRKTPFSTSGN